VKNIWFRNCSEGTFEQQQPFAESGKTVTEQDVHLFIQVFP